MVESRAAAHLGRGLDGCFGAESLAEGSRSGGRLSAADSVGVSGSGARRGASIGRGHRMRRENPQWEGGLLFYSSLLLSLYCASGCARSGFYERLGSRGAAVAVYFPLNTLL